MKIKLMKLISLILCVLMISPLFACDDGNNDESNNPPPETPKYTYYYDELVKSTVFLSYEEFNNIEDATAYAKTWRKYYEIYIPEIKTADSLKISITTYLGAGEREKVKHYVEYIYENAEPFYRLKGMTTLFQNNMFDELDFHFALDGGYSTTMVENYKYNYDKDGNISFSSEDVKYNYYPFLIRNGNLVFANGSLYLKENQEMSVEEIKALVFDNLVPLDNQSSKEIAKTFLNEKEPEMTGPIMGGRDYEDFYCLKEDIINLGNKYDFSCFVLQGNKFNKGTFSSKYSIEYGGQIFYLEGYRSGITFSEDLTYRNERQDDIYIKAVSVITPNSIVGDNEQKSFEYVLSYSQQRKEFKEVKFLGFGEDGNPITEEYTRYGYEFTIKNGNGIIMTGNVRANDINHINLQEVEQKLLSNIVLVKGE